MSRRYRDGWPGVKGGQGRSDEDVELAASGLVFAAVWIVLLAVCGAGWYYFYRAFF